MFNFWPFKKKADVMEAGGSICAGDFTEKADIVLKKSYDIREVEAQYGKEVSDILKVSKQNVFGRSFVMNTKSGVVVKIIN